MCWVDWLKSHGRWWKVRWTSPLSRQTPPEQKNITEQTLERCLRTFFMLFYFFFCYQNDMRCGMEYGWCRGIFTSAILTHNREIRSFFFQHSDELSCVFAVGGCELWNMIRWKNFITNILKISLAAATENFTKLSLLWREFAIIDARKLTGFQCLLCQLWVCMWKVASFSRCLFTSPRVNAEHCKIT